MNPQIPYQTVPSQNPLAFFNHSANKYPDSVILPPNDNRFKRARMLRSLYINHVTTLIKGKIPFKDILRYQFPTSLSVSKLPMSISLEFTNNCNLNCKYCTSSIDKRPKGFLNDETFNKLITEIKLNKTKRVYIVGNGEPTLHKKFDEFIIKLRQTTNVISVTSNLQNTSIKNLYSIAESVDMLNISVDGFNSYTYEGQRKNGSFNRLIRNITKLKNIKKKLNSKVLINLRVMVKPSEKENMKNLKSFWEKFGDVASIQYVLNFSGLRDDMFDFNTHEGYYPKCSLPFKKLDIHWNGDIPICSYYYRQANNPEEYILGNIKNIGLKGVWNSQLITHYRQAHKSRIKNKMPLCAGCIGC